MEPKPPPPVHPVTPRMRRIWVCPKCGQRVLSSSSICGRTGGEIVKSILFQRVKRPRGA